MRREQLKATVPQGLKNDPNNPRYWLKDAWRQLFITRKLISNLSYFARIDIGSIQVFASNVLLILQIAFFIPDVRFNGSGMDKVYLSLVLDSDNPLLTKSSPSLSHTQSYRVTVTECGALAPNAPNTTRTSTLLGNRLHPVACNLQFENPTLQKEAMVNCCHI